MIIVPSINARAKLPIKQPTVLFQTWRDDLINHLPYERASYSYLLSKIDAEKKLQPLILRSYQSLLSQDPSWLKQRAPCWLQHGLNKIIASLRSEYLMFPGEENHLAIMHSNKEKLSIQHFQMQNALPSALAVLEHFKSTEYAIAPTRHRHQHIVFKSLDDELQAALTWQSESPEERKVVTLSPSVYQNLYPRLSHSHLDTITLEDIINLLAPIPVISHELSHLITAQSSKAIDITKDISFTAFKQEVLIQLTQYQLLDYHHPAIQSALQALKPLLDDLAMLQKNNSLQTYTKWHEQLVQVAPFLLPNQQLSGLTQLHEVKKELWLIGFNQEELKPFSPSAWIPDLPQLTTIWEAIYQLNIPIITSSIEKNEHNEKHQIPKGSVPDSIEYYKSAKKHLPIKLMHNENIRPLTHKSISASKVQDYAQCPFKAFARHQLKIQTLKTQSIQPPPSELGNLAHQVLEVLYQPIQYQSDLKDINDNFITTVIDEQWRSLNIQTHPDLETILKDTLMNKIQVWLCTDLSRDDFEIAALESKYLLDLTDQVKIKMRVDRIDEVSGQKVVIDYKTGYANISDALNPQFTNPQLPLYALAQDSLPQIAYALIQQQPSYQSLDLANPKAIEKRQKLRRYENQDIKELITHWEKTAILQVNHFFAGHFPVQPASPMICKRCDFQALCRKDLLSSN
ncbi:PD-(D/E)XK nuclease family protein [Gammaproteobacteria bacterium]|nr:PD-(D/E)XK nuclease family protein [Gammaproteobacteria bacterium]